MPYSDHTSSTGSNIIPFPRARAMTPTEPQAEEEVRFVTAIWPRASLGDTIRSGDIIEVDMKVDAIHHDGIFLIGFESASELRRVQRLFDGRLRVGVDGAHFDVVERGALCVVGAVTRYWRAAQ